MHGSKQWCVERELSTEASVAKKITPDPRVTANVIFGAVIEGEGWKERNWSGVSLRLCECPKMARQL